MQQSTKQSVFFNNMCFESKAGPIKPNIKVPIAIEVIRAEENKNMSDSMDMVIETDFEVVYGTWP